MLTSQTLRPGLSSLRRAGLFALISVSLLLGDSSIAGNTFLQGGGFVIFGRVRLPDGHPAKARMKVFIEALNGLRRDALSDDSGNYEFRGMSGGRYRVYAINPDA